jgi:hypothetical protein
MSESSETRRRLRAANPVLPEDAPPPDSFQAEALFERIIATEPNVTGRRRRVWWQRTWVLVPAAVLAAAAGYGVFHKVSQPLVVACYATPTLTGSRAVVTSEDLGPIAACDPFWRAGGEFNTTGDAGLPPLFACVLHTGAVGVFPGTEGSDTCSALGLAPAGASGKEQGENEDIVEVQTALSERFISRCVGREEAVSMAERELADHGLVDWHVAAGRPFSEQEPCASLAVDIPGRTISLVPVPDSP